MNTATLSTVNILKKVAHQTGSSFRAEYGGAVMEWNPDIALGTTRAFEIMPGISTIIQDVTFHDDFEVIEDKPASGVLYLIYCLEGQVYHKFKNDQEYVTIPKKQSVIVNSSNNEKNHIVLPKGIHIRLSNVYIFQDKIKSAHSEKMGFFRSGLKHFFKTATFNQSHRHIGPLSSNCLQYSQVLFEEQANDFIGRIQIEAAILNIIASHFDAFSKYEVDGADASNLEEGELKTILELSEYIVDNLSRQDRIKDLVVRSGLHPKKLQAGFNFYFGETVNDFIHNAKMLKSKELIETTNLSIKDICDEIGFESGSYFSKTFAGRYGITPSKYRSHFQSTMSIYELTYYSDLTVAVEEEELQQIVRNAVKKNLHRGITGCLFVSDGGVYQIIEGDKRAVLELSTKIQSDKRHFNMKCIYRGYKGKRIFSEWSMGYVNGNRIGRKNKIKYHDLMRELNAGNHDLYVSNRIFWTHVRDELLEPSKKVQL